jgi:hypothetical protein
MTHRLMKACLIALATVASAAAASPASAAFPIPGCPPGEFSIIARTGLAFENRPANSPVTLNGNALLTQDNALAKIGSHVKIAGTVVADRLFLGTGAVVDQCVADIIEGPGVCTTVLGTFSAAPNECKQFTFTPPVVDPCVNSALLVNVPAGQTESLPPGCYGLVRLGLESTLNLQSGIYFIRELRMLDRATLSGATSGPRTRLLIKGEVNIGADSLVQHLDAATAQPTGQLQIGNNVTLIDVQVVSASAVVHVHTGSILENSVVAANSVDIEPVQFNAPPPPPPIICVCPTGTRFAVEVCAPETTCTQARTCVPDTD